MVKRRKFSAEYKARLVLELLSGQRSAADIARKEHIKDALLYEWRAQLLERAPVVFSEPTPSHESEQKVAELERLIGQLTIENEILKKASRWLQRMSRSSD